MARARRSGVAAAAAALALLVAGCSDDGGGQRAADAAPTSASASAPAPTTSATELAPAATPTTAPPAVPEGRYVEEVFTELEHERGLRYGAALDADGEQVELALDLWAPADDPLAARPVVVLVHGGGFVSGDRSSMAPYGEALARRGFVTATVSYRLRDRLPPHGWSELEPETERAAHDAQHDVQAAVRWLRAHADDHGIDPERIAVLGYSAGAITAVEVGSSPDDPGTSGTPGERSDVSAVVSIAGTAAHHDALVAPGPAVLMLHGALDATVPIAAAKATCEAARTGGLPCHLVVFEQAGHDVVATERTAIVDETTEFLVGALGLR